VAKPKIRMTRSRWAEFFTKLEGQEGCNFRLQDEKDSGSVVWKCFGDHSIARGILQRMGFKGRSVANTLKHCERHGGYCDCEIIFNTAEKMFPPNAA
jgi:Protein of unknown function (DUF2695)